MEQNAVTLDVQAQHAHWWHTRAHITARNTGSAPILCSIFAYALERRVPLEPQHFWIDASASADLTLRVPLRFPHIRRIVLEARGADFVSSASANIAVPRAWQVFGALVSLCILAAGTYAAVALRGRIAATPAPSYLTVSPVLLHGGQSVAVSYGGTFGGAVAELRDGTGRILARRPISAGAAVHFVVPKVSRAQTFDVAIGVLRAGAPMVEQRGIIVLPR